MMNPYFGQSFFEFFVTLFKRLPLLLMGAAPASDEVQIGVFMLTGIATALLGTLLVYRKMTMLANALSHTTLFGIVIAFVLSAAFSSHAELTLANLSLGVLLLAALITAILTNLCTHWLTHSMRLHADASIGLVFNAFFALGVILVTTFTRNTHLGIEAIMGNADALHVHDFKLMGSICLITVTAIGLFFKEWQITTFDAGLAHGLGFRPTWMGYGLMVLCALTTIGAFRAVGVFLVLGFLIFPTLIARRFCNRLLPLMGLAVVISCVLSMVAVALSRHMLSVCGMPLSTSGIAIVLLAGTYGFALGIKKPSSQARRVFASQ
ncbi:MAG: metal ABC transporter permease [Chlamydiia bacterium]|nr:metal ABC transporter permease [Chlamydiia bacterium]